MIINFDLFASVYAHCIQLLHFIAYLLLTMLNYLTILYRTALLLKKKPSVFCRLYTTADVLLTLPFHTLLFENI